MKVTGFTFIRNAIQYDFPVAEAIRSILPLCDDFLVAVGNSSDETLKLVRAIAPGKIRVIETVWDDSLREGGRVLALETDKAFQAIGPESDWCFYIQGDEVVHERYLDNIHKAMQRWQHDEKVDGLLFGYLHFYGSYDYVGASNRWYGHEIRVIRNNKQIYSYRDAQGFRKDDNKKLNVKPVDAYIYHYGWVKPPQAMQQKRENWVKMYHDDAWINEHVSRAAEFDYSGIDALKPFTGTHPAVMQQRIQEKNWKFDFDLSFNRFSLKDRIKNLLRKYPGIDLNYRNYKIV